MEATIGAVKIPDAMRGAAIADAMKDVSTGGRINSHERHQCYIAIPAPRDVGV
jgi:hypothetical protein